MCEYTLFNKHDPSKTYDICLEVGLNCDCKLEKSDPECAGELAVLPFGNVCRSLALDPKLPIFLDPVNEDMPLWVRYPWEPSPNASNLHPQLRVYPEGLYGKRCDYETVEKPFGWIDHVKAVICIPIHFGYHDEIILQQRVAWHKVK